jgi:hypothetical protein
MAGHCPGHLRFAARIDLCGGAAFHCKEQWIYNAPAAPRLAKALKTLPPAHIAQQHRALWNNADQ